MKSRASLLILFAAWLGLLSTSRQTPPGHSAQVDEASRFVDLSLLVAPEYPCTWPTFPVFQINHYQRIGRLSPYNADILVIDGNTGTQLDVPPHSVTPPDSGLANAGKFGLSFTDKVPPGSSWVRPASSTARTSSTPRRRGGAT